MLPLIKWAGGKRQIIDKLLKYAPDEFNTYYEPFVGGGALLFELSPKKANDICAIFNLKYKKLWLVTQFEL